VFCDEFDTVLFFANYLKLLLLDEGLGIIIGKYLNCYCWDTLYEYCDKKHINYKWLVELIIKLCNIGNTRCIPYIALTANLEFSKGILKGYYYYNNINNNSFYIWDNSIYTCSLYSELLDGFINILSLFKFF
jgi:hypothetical protein